MADQTEYRDEVATFGDRLAAAREGLGLSQEDLARHIGVRRETLAAWEDDRREPRANRLALLAGVTGAPLRWLLSGEGETPGFVTEDLAIQAAPDLNVIVLRGAPSKIAPPFNSTILAYSLCAKKMAKSALPFWSVAA